MDSYIRLKTPISIEDIELYSEDGNYGLDEVFITIDGQPIYVDETESVNTKAYNHLKLKAGRLYGKIHTSYDSETDRQKDIFGNIYVTKEDICDIFGPIVYTIEGDRYSDKGSIMHRMKEIVYVYLNSKGEVPKFKRLLKKLDKGKNK